MHSMQGPCLVQWFAHSKVSGLFVCFCLLLSAREALYSAAWCQAETILTDPNYAFPLAVWHFVLVVYCQNSKFDFVVQYIIQLLPEHAMLPQVRLAVPAAWLLLLRPWTAWSVDLWDVLAVIATTRSAFAH